MAPPPMPSQGEKRLTLAALFIAALLGLYRAQPDYSGVWTVTRPGSSITVLRDIHHGAVLWLYLDGKFLGRWQLGGPPSYPTSTPSPGPGRRMLVKSV